MIDKADRARDDDAGHGPGGGTPGAPGGGQAEVSALLGHYEGPAGPIVYTELRPEARVEAGDLTSSPGAEEFGRIAEAVLAGQDPRIVGVLMITDDRDDPDARVVTGVELARQLARRPTRVLLIDADFRAAGISGQLGQDDHLGLVDIARYGASPRPCIQATGIPNVGLLGIGSFRPDEEEPFSDEELRHALAQVRALADIVLMVAPTRLRDGTFNPLLAYVDGVVLTVTLRHASADLLEGTVGYLSRLGIPVRGLAAFTHPNDQGPSAVAAASVGSQWDTVDVPSPGTVPPAPRVPFQTSTAAAASEPATAGAGAPATDPAGSVSRLERVADPADAESEHLASTPAAEPDGGDWDDAQSSPASHEADYARAARSSSPVFRLLTGALLVLVLGFGGWWVLVQRSQRAMEPLRHGPSGAPPSQLQGDSATAPRPAGESSDGKSPSPVVPQPPPAAPTASPTVAEPPAQPSSAAEGASTSTSRVGGSPDAEVAFPEDEIPGNARASGGAAKPAPATLPPVEQAVAPSTASPGTPAAPPRVEDEARLRQQLQASVGAGYALHVWSFPDSMEAVGACAPLARDGMVPSVRGAIVKEKLWYRVLVGSFATRADAMAARGLLAGHRGIDYVGVVRVQP